MEHTERIQDPSSPAGRNQNQKPTDPATSIFMSVFGLEGVAAFVAFSARKKLSPGASLVGASRLGSTKEKEKLPPPLSCQTILTQVAENTPGETLDLAALDPSVDPKELFKNIISQLRTPSNLKEIKNCPSFELSAQEYLPGKPDVAELCTC